MLLARPLLFIARLGNVNVEDVIAVINQGEFNRRRIQSSLHIRRRPRKRKAAVSRRWNELAAEGGDALCRDSCQGPATADGVECPDFHTQTGRK